MGSGPFLQGPRITLQHHNSAPERVHTLVMTGNFPIRTASRIRMRKLEVTMDTGHIVGGGCTVIPTGTNPFHSGGGAGLQATHRSELTNKVSYIKACLTRNSSSRIPLSPLRTSFYFLPQLPPYTGLVDHTVKTLPS